MFELIEVKYKDIVDIPNLSISRGLTVLLGPSGGGKTTILRMLNKMISPTRGRILFDGKDLKQIKSVEHRRNVMMLSQNPAMYEGTLRDNLTIALRFQEKESPGDDELYKILSGVRLHKDLETPVYQLSGGEKQRLALGRLFLCDPAVYLLDEPSSALDDDTEDAIIKMVSEHIETTRKSVVMITHSKALAEKYADEIIEISDGKIISRRAVYERNN
jgi:putative ABC transport system ATP-binding protein